jgi:hypothetical protein
VLLFLIFSGNWMKKSFIGTLVVFFCIPQFTGMLAENIKINGQSIKGNGQLSEVKQDGRNSPGGWLPNRNQLYNTIKLENVAPLAILGAITGYMLLAFLTDKEASDGTGRRTGGLSALVSVFFGIPIVAKLKARELCQELKKQEKDTVAIND